MSKTGARDEQLRRLCKDEIERRIDSLAQRVAVDGGEHCGPLEGRPRWISAAELVRRVRPFLALN